MAVDIAPDPLLQALRARGIPLRRVQYRENRSVLLSMSRDGRTLNCHACFRHAPPDIADAIAGFLRSRRGSPQYRRTLARIRGWDGAREGLERARRVRPRRRPPVDHGGSPESGALTRLYQRFNRTRFGNRLPAIPLRVSRRMTRSLGTISYEGSDDGDGPRAVREIAISADLLRPANRALLEDTLLHEMAHAEAWIVHGHRRHGGIWRAIAERVGCTPRALIHARVKGRRH